MEKNHSTNRTSCYRRCKCTMDNSPNTPHIIQWWALELRCNNWDCNTYLQRLMCPLAFLFISFSPVFPQAPFNLQKNKTFKYILQSGKKCQCLLFLFPFIFFSDFQKVTSTDPSIMDIFCNILKQKFFKEILHNSQRTWASKKKIRSFWLYPMVAVVMESQTTDHRGKR